MIQIADMKSLNKTALGRLFGLGACAVLGLHATLAEAADRSLPLRGVVTPVHEAVVATELLARIIHLPWQEGDRFAKDDVLIAFDCAKYKALRATAAAEREVRQIQFVSNQALHKQRAIAQHEVQIAEVEVKKAQGRVDELDVQLAQCEFRAPYDGRLKQVYVHEHEIPSANTPLFEIVSDGNLEIELIVSSVWLKWLRHGDEFQVQLDETGLDYKAEVRRFGAHVDPVSQTVKVFGTFIEAPTGVLNGMSGPARFQQPES